MKLDKTILSLAISMAISATAVSANPHHEDHHDHDNSKIKHVLLISIDGMHSLDYINCAKGIDGVNGGAPYCPNLAALGTTGINYLQATTSRPSDSFPGLMALVSGGTPRTVGAFYDVSYDRALNPPTITTGNGIAGGTCTPGATPTGTRTEYEEGIDLDQTKLNGGAPSGDGGINSIDPKKLIRDQNCNPVYPWNFVRTNTIFGVAHEAGMYTAWSDKHPAYSSVAGPGDGSNLSDYYAPEINSTVIALPGVVTPTGVSCATIRDNTHTGAWSDSFDNIQCYDTLKVNGILNQINGKRHDGNSEAPVPAIFGMNFQAVSIGEKLIEQSVGKTGGYMDSEGRPSDALLNEIQFVDAAIGQFVDALKTNHKLDSTLIVIAAKHGQSTIDPARFFPIPGPNGNNGSSPATILDNAGLLPYSESPSNPTGIGPTEDDISVIWLNDSSKTEEAVTLLQKQSPPTDNIAGIGEIYSGASLTQIFNSPDQDTRSPDIIVTPNVGVIYTGSSKKLSEHGGWSHDDTNTVLLLSNPKFNAKTVNAPVENTSVAPTILSALGLNPNALKSVQIEHTPLLPALPFQNKE